MKRKKRTKKAYQNLYHDPESLFPNVKTILFPNGENEIWFSADLGKLGFRLQVSNGPAGLGLSLSKFVFTPNITFTSDKSGYEDLWIDCVQYRQDERSQAFKVAYREKKLDDFEKVWGEKQNE